VTYLVPGATEAGGPAGGAEVPTGGVISLVSSSGIMPLGTGEGAISVAAGGASVAAGGGATAVGMEAGGAARVPAALHSSVMVTVTALLCQ
jgi:hypothetical protein